MLRVFNKTTCALKSSQSLTTFFASTGIGPNVIVIIPRIIFDRRSRRFFLVATGNDTANGDRYTLYAVSTDSSASAWAKYRIDINVGSGSQCGSDGDWFNVSIGVQDKRWVITSNYRSAGQAVHALLSIDKAPTLTGVPSPGFKCFEFINAALKAPIVYDLQSHATILGFPSPDQPTKINRFELDVSPVSVASDNLVQLPDYTVASRVRPTSVTQPGGQLLLLAGGAPSVQIGASLWMVETVKVGTFARWRLYRFGNASTGSSPVLLTFTGPSTVAGNNDDIFNPSVAIGGAAAGSAAFVTAIRTIASQTVGYHGNPTMLVFEGPNNSNNAADWTFSIAAQSKFRFVKDGQGNSCNASPDVNGCLLGQVATSTQTEFGGVNSAIRAWSFAPLPAGTIQFNWKSRAVRSEFGPF